MSTPTQKIFLWIETGLSLFRVILGSKFKTDWKIKPKSAQINILGNGPSLEFIEKKDLEGDIIVVNNFAVSGKFEEFKPGLYILNAPEYWMPNVDEEYIAMREKLIEAINSKLRWKMTFLVPFEAKKTSFIKAMTQNNFITIQCYNTTAVEGLPLFTHFLFNHKLGMPRPHNVLIPSIMTSIWSGYSIIILFGADHSWLKEIIVDNDNNVFLTQKHFYDYNHAKPDVMKKLGKGKRKLHEILEKFYLAFKAYHVIQNYSTSIGKRIYNHSSLSYIDAFPKIHKKN